MITLHVKKQDLAQTIDKFKKDGFVHAAFYEQHKVDRSVPIRDEDGKEILNDRGQPVEKVKTFTFVKTLLLMTASGMVKLHFPETSEDELLKLWPDAQHVANGIG